MTLLAYSQTISINSLYYTYNDTIMFKHKNRFYFTMLWLSFNDGQQRLLDKVLRDRECTHKFPSPIGYLRTYSPEILKYVFNESDSIIYQIRYICEDLTVKKVSLDGSALYYTDSLKVGTPEYFEWIDAWRERNFLSNDFKIGKYISDNLLKLKDIDAQFQNNILILRCYKYQKQLVVFQYDFAKKEWSITEDRDLTEAEIDSLGFYADEPKELHK